MTSPRTSADTAADRPPRLLDRLADALRTRGYVAALRQAYVDWARRYIHFHQLRHPQDLGAPEVAAFLASLADNPDLPPSAEAEARAALAFLYDIVLGRPLGDLATPSGQDQGTEDNLKLRADGAGPRLLDQLRHLLRVRHYARRTEDCYVDWARRFILFHQKRHPLDMGSLHVEQFLTHLAVQGNVADQLLTSLVEGDLGAARVVGSGVDLQHVFHRRLEAGVGLRWQHPLLLPPRLDLVWFRVCQTGPVGLDSQTDSMQAITLTVRYS